ncbi:hypothetical protein [Nocardioides sp. GY 10127]|uniref:hypothetical protein n=1 Tax=Nocardioides sp. GY 10127 TaxID=2569762 RepID=UPI0010A87C25|nr:hypothetical protein [Nocardioides sp. GY 10127]TIC80709.1 hypothetical protein E8D37_12520 [Nocardioides sp. GY 10127]
MTRVPPLLLLALVPWVVSCGGSDEPGVSELAAFCDAVHDPTNQVAGVTGADGILSVPAVGDALTALENSAATDPEWQNKIDLMVSLANDPTTATAFRDGVLQVGCENDFPNRYGD